MDSWSNIPPPESGGFPGAPPPPPPSGGPETFPDEIEHVKGIVGKYFPIYEVRIQFNTISLHCNIDPSQLESQFEALRNEMKGDNYIPILKYEKGEYVVHVVRQPKMKFKGITFNLVLLIATIITTILAGSLLWLLIMNDPTDSLSMWQMFDLGNLANGALFFALPLMTILGVHEMAHYYAAKRHGIAASLPFFIPVPPIFIPPLGTMGAFISIREPIPNKKALLDIGISGPIAGFLVAIPVTIIGLMLSSSLTIPNPTGIVEGGTILIGDSILFQSLRSVLPIPDNVLLHPTAFAGWVGLFVTALNLLPAGQLDGGHIAQALLGNRARWASYGAFILMLILGLQFTGWLIFAMLIMFLGLRHPPPLNDVTKLDDKRKLIGIATAVILVLCFVPIPFDYEEPVYDVEFNLVMPDGTLTTSHTYTFNAFPQGLNRTEDLALANNGNVEATIVLRASSSNESICNVTFFGGNVTDGTDVTQSIQIAPMGIANLTINLRILPNAVGNATIIIEAAYLYGDLLLDPNNFDLNPEIRIFLELI